MNQELMFKFQEINQRSEAVNEQLKVVEKQISELNSFRESVKHLKDNEEKEILAGIGKGVYIKSDIKDRGLFVEVGSEVFVRKTLDETSDVIEQQISRLNEMRMHLTTEMSSINVEAEKLIEESQKSEE